MAVDTNSVAKYIIDFFCFLTKNTSFESRDFNLNELFRALVLLLLSSMFLPLLNSTVSAVKSLNRAGIQQKKKKNFICVEDI